MARDRWARPGILDDLLTTLEVRLHAWSLCEIQRGFRLAFDPMDAVVVHYVLRGEGMLHQQGDAPVPFGPKSIMIVAPGRAQTLAAEPVSHDVLAAKACRLLADGLLKFDAHEGEGDLLVACGTISATFGGRFGLFDHQTGPLAEDVSGWPEFQAAFDMLLRELSDPRAGTRALTEALMKQCLIMLLREQLARSGPNAPVFKMLGEPRLARVVALVIARPGASHTLDSLAEEAGMSRSAFAERFYVTYGQSPFEFVQMVRLRYSARLLTVSDLQVTAIAQAVGYASRSHFSRAFRSAFGVDPTTYRRDRPPDDELPAPIIKRPKEK